MGHGMNDKSSLRSKLTRRLMRLPFVATLLRVPPFSWLAAFVIRLIVDQQRRQNARVTPQFTPDFTSTDLSYTLKYIVTQVVDSLGYAGSMLATYEQGDVLPVRAYYIDPNIATEDQITRWEKEVGRITGKNLSLSDPKVARVYRFKPEYHSNLSIQAVEAKRPILDDNLYSLFVPILDESAKPLINIIQQALGITHVMAVPFFVAGEVDPVGNLFVAKRGAITEKDEVVLRAFAQQAALALDSDRRRKQIELIQELIYRIQANLDNEELLLKQVVHGIVDQLGFVGAMIATYEDDGSLPIRTYYIDPNIERSPAFDQWERKLDQLVKVNNRKRTPTHKIFAYDPECEDNLSIMAMRQGKPVSSKDMFDLFDPLIPSAPGVRHQLHHLQADLGIGQVIAIPFFVRDEHGHQDFVGNLFAATRSSRFNSTDIQLLYMFGQQAAVGIRNARTYRLAQNRQEVAQIFARIAFGVAADLHDLKNVIAMPLIAAHMISPSSHIGATNRQQVIDEFAPKIAEKLQIAKTILDNLYEPWHQNLDMPVSTNMCIEEAIEKTQMRADYNVAIEKSLEAALPLIITSKHMLTEVFRIIVRYIITRIKDAHMEDGRIHIVSNHQRADNRVVVTITHNGPVLQASEAARIFQLDWGTAKKLSVMEYGLFWAKEYIESLAGHIDAFTTESNETTFRISLLTYQS
ncbi:MAG: hypothetical protein OHK0046_36200 [Anaerolineae bacterium]